MHQDNPEETFSPDTVFYEFSDSPIDGVGDPDETIGGTFVEGGDLDDERPSDPDGDANEVDPDDKP